MRTLKSVDHPEALRQQPCHAALDIARFGENLFGTLHNTIDFSIPRSILSTTAATPITP
jgi:hypothetical protein